VKKRHNSNFSVRVCLIFSVVIIFLLAGCEGPTGPAGPVGPQGPAGPAGPAGQDFTYWSGYATVNSNGLARVHLPVGAGTSSETPLITCYIGFAGIWLLLGTDGGTLSTVALYWQTNHWVAQLVNADPGWTFWVIAAW